MQTKANDFKAVEWVRQVRDQNHELTQNMTVEERVAFYREASRRFHDRLIALGIAVPLQHTTRA